MSPAATPALCAPSRWPAGVPLGWSAPPKSGTGWSWPRKLGAWLVGTHLSLAQVGLQHVAPCPLTSHWLRLACSAALSLSASSARCSTCCSSDCSSASSAFWELTVSNKACVSNRVGCVVGCAQGGMCTGWDVSRVEQAAGLTGSSGSSTGWSRQQQQQWHRTHRVGWNRGRQAAVAQDAQGASARNMLTTRCMQSFRE